MGRFDFNSCDAFIRASEWAGLQKLHSFFRSEVWCLVAFWHKFQFYSPDSMTGWAGPWSCGKCICVCLCVRARSHDVESWDLKCKILDVKGMPTGLLIQPSWLTDWCNMYTCRIMADNWIINQFKRINRYSFSKKTKLKTVYILHYTITAWQHLQYLCGWTT